MATTLVFLSLSACVWLAYPLAPSAAQDFSTKHLRPLKERLHALDLAQHATRLHWLIALSGGSAALVFGLILGSVWAGLLGLLAGVLAPWVWVRRMEAARKRKFAGQLVDSLEMLTGALRAGQSLQQALATVALEAPRPAADYWGQVAGQVRLGLEVDLALDKLAEGLQGTAMQADLGILSTAVAVNRAAGGNLAETFQRQIETLRERARLRAQVEALTAQGKLSGWVVGLLPVFLLGAIQLVDPGLVEPLFTTAPGWGLLALGLVLEGIGAWLIGRITAIEV